MKKIIGGKIYDTNTAECVHAYSSRHNHDDSNWYEETLYKTKKGVYFLAGTGGPLTKYGVRFGNELYGMPDISLLSINEALSWCESHDMAADEISDVFSDYVTEG